MGANLGEARQTLETAAAELAATVGVQDLTLAHFYSTAPVDSSGPDYVNTVVRFSCKLTPEALLDRLQAIEQEHGRTRLYRNAPRTLDLDLLLYGQAQIQTERLIVPHPRMHERAFVLVPLADLAPELELAQGHINALLESVRGQGIRRLD
ncbi:2-amino-4-hydroxy-6-hydroxymethyldihydropteridine diphosphokinase [Alcaligenes faecalis]|uniref:2-amino-4-hydroxy-6- hydroxymethyldihydropteridine diphosphokinase n=1 Tax=Alcaligenes faecalis TaxID=511 RepID=UPI0029333777|nr:2-amino-4-hydroxy-6-hydroxymethyldihydropteridine diphosphokinase [Alcaligenes faecalis]MDV2115727.1 2-amino-4-hydroxy-6-hydroxymethyldihydropteridine diphosphokinase [Alcaligenes faecalis]